MPDIIYLLPDEVANQIAAGEVVQRPASVVKELLENAVDAQSKHVKLIVKDAGKTLIQVIDDGIGMSQQDARMSFERHATSKLKKSEDLFALFTKGFRGEALASIASVAQVELKTKKPEQDIGTLVVIEGSQLIKQDVISTPIGSSFTVKNLFFNVPARRNFLKSDAVELRHILDEFLRVAIAHPEIAFTLYSNEAELYNLPSANYRQRIIAVLGNNYNERLIPIEETTDVVTISGYLVKPQYAKKTRAISIFFVNKRFIKSSYLNHAVQNAYSDLISSDAFASYFINLEITPSKIDVNIHPTKTEIKFEDEKVIYAILHSAAKKSLGKHNITPTIDFNQEASIFNMPLASKDSILKPPQIKVDPNYNPFSKSNDNVLNKTKPNWNAAIDAFIKNKTNTTNSDFEAEQINVTSSFNKDFENTDNKFTNKYFQIHHTYILAQIKSGFILINQQFAHERILFEKYLNRLNNKPKVFQQELFPITITLLNNEYIMVKEQLNEIKLLGFDIRDFGLNQLVVHAVPDDFKISEAKELIEKWLENYKNSVLDYGKENRESLAKSLAITNTIKNGKSLSYDEMSLIVDELFATSNPNYGLNGLPIYITITLEDIITKFSK